MFYPLTIYFWGMIGRYRRSIRNVSSEKRSSRNRHRRVLLIRITVLQEIRSQKVEVLMTWSIWFTAVSVSTSKYFVVLTMNLFQTHSSSNLSMDRKRGLSPTLTSITTMDRITTTHRSKLEKNTGNNHENISYSRITLKGCLTRQ